jgi:hypothetical protein
MVKAKAHGWEPALLTEQEALFAQFATVALLIGQARAPIDAHDVTEVLALKPFQKQAARLMAPVSRAVSREGCSSCWRCCPGRDRSARQHPCGILA